MRYRYASAAIGAVALMLGGCQPGYGSQQDAGTVLGGVAGGLLGSRFGHGSGQVVAAATGAVAGGLVGGAIGRSMDQNARPSPQGSPAGGQVSGTPVPPAPAAYQSPPPAPVPDTSSTPRPVETARNPPARSASSSYRPSFDKSIRCQVHLKFMSQLSKQSGDQAAARSYAGLHDHVAAASLMFASALRLSETEYDAAVKKFRDANYDLGKLGSSQVMANYERDSEMCGASAISTLVDQAKSVTSR